MMKAQFGVEAIMFIIVAIVIIGGLIYAIIANVGGLGDALNGMLRTTGSTAQNMLSGGETTCAGLAPACRKWVHEGLGLTFTYHESKVYEPAYRCKMIICPEFPAGRISIIPCLNMCTEVLDCEMNFEELGYADMPQCIDKVIKPFQEET